VQASSSIASPSPAVDAVALDLGVLLKHLLRSTNRDFFHALERAGISFSQVKCLGLLADAEAPIALSELADELGLSLPAASRAVDGLVQRSEVKREEHARDRRSKVVTVTPRGRRTFEDLVAVRMAGMRRMLGQLGPAELDALGASLGPVVRRLGL
jgi:DNA-binding MarR family transcriptional regulator